MGLTASEGPAELAATPASQAGSRVASGVLLSVAYAGDAFAGFAAQPGQRTVSGVLLDAIRALDPSVEAVRGASRTDTGVHALDAPVAFDAAQAIDPRGWALGLARHLPDDLSVRRAAWCAAGLEPRFLARRKIYRYRLLNDPVRDPFLDKRAWRVEGCDPKGIAAMRQEATSLIGTHDFRAFRSSADQRQNTQRTIARAELLATERELSVEIEGSGFMHNMVRIIVGTLVDVGRGRLAPGAIERAIASGARTDLGITAPPHGLYLVAVDLEANLEGAWPSAPPPWPTES